MSKPPNYIKFYNQYLHLAIPGSFSGEYQTECPILNCKKEDHFYANVDSGLWHCKRCEASGNNQSLITLLHSQALAQTLPQQLKFISNVRKIDIEILKLANFAYDEFYDRWYVPYYTFDITKRSYSSFLNNLGIFYPSLSNPREQYKIYKGASFATHLYNPGIMKKDVELDKAYISEGEWDGLAYYENYIDRYILGKPGAGFTQYAVKSLKQSIYIYTMLDNDIAGQKQTNRAIEIIREEVPKATILAIDWTTIPQAPKDVRDLHIQKRVELIEASFTIMEKPNQSIQVHMDREGDDEADPASYIRDIETVEPVYGFDNYTTQLRNNNLELSPKTCNSVLALLAIPLTTHIGGVPIWTFLRGPGACIASDVIVKVNRARNTFDITMKDLFHRFHGGIAGGKTWRSDIVTRIQQRAEDGSIQLVLINNVMYSGVKKLYKLITETGKEIRTSADHKFLTTTGWKRLSKLRVGDYVYSNQGRREGNNIRKPVKINTRVGCIYHPHAQQKIVNRISDGYSLMYHRVVVEANLNGTDVETFLYIVRNLKTVAAKLTYLNPETDHVHHIDGNRKNNDLSNLKVMNASEHKKMHSTEEYFVNVLEQALPDRIISISEDIVEDVYDLSVDHPHNFLANGIVVHNSGKSTWTDSFGGENQLFDCLSKISAKSLVSGYRDEEGLTTSYLPLLINKTLCIKDFTVTLMSSPDELNQVMGTLTDIYDGRIKIHYGNAKMNDFKNTHFNMIACVTPLIDGFNASNIGDRFLRIDWLGNDTDRAKFTHNAIAALDKEKEIDKQLLSRLTLGYLKGQMATEIKTKMDWEIIATLQQLADFTATLSTKIVTDRHDGMKFRPEPQLGARIGKQLGKIYLGVRHMVGNEKGMEVARKVSFDTCKGFPLDIVKHLLINKFTTRNEIGDALSLSSTQAHKLIGELITLKIITEAKTFQLGRGRPTQNYTIHQNLLPALQDGSYSKTRPTIQPKTNVSRLVPPRRTKTT